MDIQAQFKSININPIGSSKNDLSRAQPYTSQNNLSKSRYLNGSNASLSNAKIGNNASPSMILTKSPSNIIINEEDVMGQVKISGFNREHSFNFASDTTAYVIYL